MSSTDDESSLVLGADKADRKLNWRLCGAQNSKCKNVGQHLCGQCGGVYYCSEACQKSHWEFHQGACKNSCKPGAAYFEQTFKNFNIFQLRNCLVEKSKSFDEKKKMALIAEVEKCLGNKDSTIIKEQLLKLVNMNCKWTEIEVLLCNKQYDQDEMLALQEAEAMQQQSKSAGKGVKVINQQAKQKRPLGKSGSGSGLDKQTNDPYDPVTIKRNVEMMRKHPDMVRKQNPMFAKMTNADIFQQADMMEEMAKNPEKYKDPSKMDFSQLKSEDIARNAKMMRSNPELVRKQNADMAKMSDKEIRAMADQLEELSKDPEQVEMWKQQMEVHKTMTPETKSVFSHFQDSMKADFKFTDDWAKKTITIAKENKDIVKDLYKGTAKNPKLKDQNIDESQVSYFIDMVLGLPDWVLFYAFKAVMWIREVAYPPAKKIYEVLDSWTFGFAKNIVTLIVIVIAYYIMSKVFRVVWWVLSTLFFVSKSLWRLFSPATSAQTPPVIIYDASSGVHEPVVKFDTDPASDDF